MMTRDQKEQLCSFAASLLVPPDKDLADDLSQDGLRSLVEECASECGDSMHFQALLSKEKGGDNLLSVLTKEYARIFDQWEGERISLVESTYKPWTGDKSCVLAFASSRGLVMGDSACHMLEIYKQAALEVPEEFRSMPDHLVLELEFLAMLYQSASEEQIKRFIEDHLDWIPELMEEMKRVNPHPFYWNAVELIHVFLQNEVKKQEGYNA